MSRPVRYSSRLLPLEAYLPGRGTRPTRICDDPSLLARKLGPISWSDNLRWLFAADLYNNGFYWEAHEAWEGIWHAHERRGFAADLLKGLIQTAAAHLKQLQDIERGREILSKSSLALLQNVREQCRGLAFGLDVAFFSLRHATWFATEEMSSFPFVTLELPRIAEMERP